MIRQSYYFYVFTGERGTGGEVEKKVYDQPGWFPDTDP